MGEIQKQIQQIREENRLILQRLGDVLGEDVDTCSDCRGHINQSELKDLDQRVADIEERDRKKQDEVNAVKREIDQFQKELNHFLNSTNAPKQIREISRADQHGEQYLMKSDAAPESSREGLGSEAKRQNDPIVKPSYPNSDRSELDVEESKYKHTSHKASSDRADRDQASSNSGDKGGGASTQKTKTEKAGQNFKKKESRASANEYSKSADTVQSLSKDVKVNKTSGRNRKADGRKILKPNFLIQHDTKQKESKLQASSRNYSKPGVIKEEHKRYIPLPLWWEVCKAEEAAGFNSEVQFLDGVHTVLCVDISESMAECWRQVQTFVYDYLDGLEKLVQEENFNEENVALVTFGHQTRAQIRLTKDLSRVRRAFEGITLGGPSPLFGGILTAVCVAQSNHRKCFVNGVEIHKRIVLISDGQFTGTELSNGPDKVETNASKQDESMAHLIDVIERFPGSGKELICVPVGEPNELLHEQLEVIACGKRLSYTEGTKLARRFYLTTKSSSLFSGLSDMLGLGAFSLPGIKMEIDGLGGTTDLSNLSTADKESIQEIMEDLKKLTLETFNRRMSSWEGVMYVESDSEILPKIGSRVRRGPDWDWGNQDSQGPGTVIGHDKDGMQVWVDWDADGHTNTYHYGNAGRYDVLLVDEPRIVGLNDNLKVGCVVQPGDRWRYDFRRIKQDEEGVVIRVSKTNTVQVRWECGYRGDYSYSTRSPSELKIAARCIRHQSQDYMQKRNKNKNARH